MELYRAAVRAGDLLGQDASKQELEEVAGVFFGPLDHCVYAAKSFKRLKDGSDGGGRVLGRNPFLASRPDRLRHPLDKWHGVLTVFYFAASSAWAMAELTKAIADSFVNMAAFLAPASPINRVASKSGSSPGRS